MYKMGLINSDIPLKDTYSEIDEIKIGEDSNYYLHFFNNTLDFNCIANLQGYFEIINPQFENVLGYSKKELLASRFLDFIHEDDIKGTLNEIEKLKTGIKTINFTNRYRKKDGNYIWLEWNSTSDVASGKIYAIARDITVKKKADEQLTIYIHFFNNTFDFNCIANVEGYFEIINPQFEKILGYTKKELLESRFLDFIHADDIAGTLGEIEKLKQGITTINFSNRYRKKDGNYIWLEWNSTSDVSSGKIFAIARDITAKKLAEEALNKKTEELATNEKKFQDIFESLPGLFLVLSIDFKIIAVSNSYLEATMTKREEILGRLMFDVFPDDPNDNLPSAIDNLKASFSRVLQTKLPDKMVAQEHDIKRPEPGDDFFEVMYWVPYNSPVIDSNGNIIYIIHHVENIIKRKKLLNSFENKLLQFQKNK